MDLAHFFIVFNWIYLSLSVCNAFETGLFLPISILKKYSIFIIVKYLKCLQHHFMEVVTLQYHYKMQKALLRYS